MYEVLRLLHLGEASLLDYDLQAGFISVTPLSLVYKFVAVPDLQRSILSRLSILPISSQSRTIAGKSPLPSSKAG
jgi:hypothetical protein